MTNEINGKRLVFGDAEQIAWLKQQARLKEAAENGYVMVEVEENPLGATPIKDITLLISFTCPGCLERHRFSLLMMDEELNYTAPCGVEFQYDVCEERLQLKTA